MKIRRSAALVNTFALAAALALAAGAIGADAIPPDALEWFDVFAPLGPPKLAADERALLESGAVLVRDLTPSGADGIGVLVVGRVEAKPDDVWAVMADCDEQDEFMPRVVEASVHDRDRDAHTCQLTIDLPYPLGDVQTRTRHRVRRLPDGGMQRYWHLLPGDWAYQRSSGSWTVHPEADGHRSLLVNRMDLLPKSAIPTWILHAATGRQAPATFEAIRSRIAQRTRHTVSNE